MEIFLLDRYKYLDNQIDRLTEVKNKMNTRSQCSQTEENRPYKPYIYRGREIILAMTEVWWRQMKF